MKVLIFLFFVGVTLSDPVPKYNGYNYHENLGIKLAAKIKAAEEAPGARIIGGSAVTLGQYPFMAGILITLRSGYQSVCGGSVLTNTKVITAAHCWWDGRNKARLFTVTMGSIYVNSGGIRRPTTEVVVHPSWDAHSKSYDVAIATFAWTSFTSNIQAIALPSGSLLYNDLVGASVETLGFGVRSDDGSISSSQTLQSASLTIINTTICKNLYGPEVTDTTFCAWGEDGRSTCDGDTGGPLIMKAGETILVGIAAFNHRQSCQLGYPVGFTRVGPYVDWIKQQISW